MYQSSFCLVSAECRYINFIRSQTLKRYETQYQKIECSVSIVDQYEGVGKGREGRREAKLYSKSGKEGKKTNQ